MSKVEKVDPLVADQLQAALPSALIGRQIIVLAQTGSTNDAILEVGAGKSNEGLVLFAEHQTAGRGQRGNRWESPAGKGLWFSILVRPAIQLRDSGRLTVWAIEAISDVIRTEFRLEPAIKLPNAAAVNQTPIICPTKARGASLVIELRPTGLKASSPTVWKK